MANRTKTVTVEVPNTTTTVDKNKVHLCVWRDPEGMPRAYGAAVDKRVARKIAEQQRIKYEKKSGIDLVSFDISRVSLDSSGE